MLDGLWHVFVRALHKPWRRPVLLTFSFVQPLWWLLLFGPLFAGSLTQGAALGLDYRSFVSPGVSLMTLLFGASQAGIGLLRDAQTGLLARMLGTPTSAGALLLGKLAADVTRFLLLALAVLGMAVLLGAQLSPRWMALPLALLAFVAAGALFASWSCLIATLGREPEVMGAYVHIVNLPILFTSSALVPARRFPEWLGWLAAINPLSLAADAWRGLWLGLPMPGAMEVSALAFAALVSFAIAAGALTQLARGGLPRLARVRQPRS